MRHDPQDIAIAGGFLLFAILTTLIAIGPDLSGRATTGTQVQIVNSTPTDCTVTGAAGHNVVSIPCITDAEPRASVIDDTDLWAMYQYTPTTSDAWRAHNPNLPSWVVSDLEYLSRRVGYVLVLNASRTYQVSGILASSTSIPIIAGWSLVGYPAVNATNITQGIDGVNDTVTVVRAYYPADDGYRAYYPAAQTGNLTNLTPGLGYWMNGTGSDTWTVTP